MKILPTHIKSIIFFLLLSGLLYPAKPQPLNTSGSRQIMLFNTGWKFLLDDKPGSEKISLDDSNWREVNLPHDWSIEGTYDKDAPGGGSFGYLPAGIGWYRNHFQITKSELQKNISVEFDGVYMNSDV